MDSNQKKPTATTQKKPQSTLISIPFPKKVFAESFAFSLQAKGIKVSLQEGSNNVLVDPQQTGLKQAIKDATQEIIDIVTFNQQKALLDIEKAVYTNININNKPTAAIKIFLSDEQRETLEKILTSGDVKYYGLTGGIGIISNPKNLNKLEAASIIKGKKFSELKKEAIKSKTELLQGIKTATAIDFGMD